MLPFAAIDDKFWQWLFEIDTRIGARVAAQRCQHCKGVLHRGNYPRKPRGGLLVIAEESLSRRISYCCSRRGCRRRATPPSVRFLGRRVYVGVAVMLVCEAALAVAKAAEIVRLAGIPARTVRRWQAWWHGDFVASLFFEEQRGRFIPPLDRAGLPATLRARFSAAASADNPTNALVRMCAFLAPLTTSSVTNGARFVRLE